MTHVFRRVLTRELPRAAHAEGVWITDTDGKRYLDGAGGAIVSNVGHGDPAVLAAMAEQACHGNTFGALDVGGKDALKGPYRPWLGRFRHTETPYEYRCSMPEHPVDCGVRYGEALEALILEIGPENVAAFLAEPIGGATLGATVPTDAYWPGTAAGRRRP